MGISHRTGVSVSVSDLRSGLTLSHELHRTPQSPVLRFSFRTCLGIRDPTTAESQRDTGTHTLTPRESAERDLDVLDLSESTFPTNLSH